MKNIFSLSDNLKINFGTSSITDCNDKEISHLTKKQRLALQILVENNTRKVSYDYFIMDVWDSSGSEQNVRDTVNQLRKLGGGLLAPYIKTAQGGYIFNCDYPQDADDEIEGLFPITEPASFPIPAHYIVRAECGEMLRGKFAESGQVIHAIVGERGLGKTSLSQRFAAEALKCGRYKYIFSQSYASSIRETIEHIGGKGGAGDPFSDTLSRLSRLNKSGKVLILIDNYDCPTPSAELAFDNDDYRRLAETGCSILFTSSCDLAGCHLIGDSVTHLSKIPTKRLEELFYLVKGQKTDDHLDVRRLIEDYLYSNTYLVVLCGELAKQNMSAGEIISAIEGLGADDTDVISVQKDGMRQDEKTLLEHYCRVLDKNKTVNPDDEKERREMHGVLSMLALMPIGGIECDDLEALACDRRTRKDFKRCIAKLRRHNLVFGEERITIQPLVREYLLREIFATGADACRYIKNLAEFVDIHSYTDSFRYWLSIAEAAWRVIGDEYIFSDACERAGELDRSEEILSLAVLMASRITSSYSAVNMYAKAYEYGADVLPTLLLIPQAREQYLDKLTLATCFNSVGYAHMHAPSGDRTKSLKTAYDCIKRGMELASSALEDGDDSAKAVLSKLHGELAAYYSKRGDHSSALEYHLLALGEREELLASDPSCAEYRRMLAFTYRGLGTDHYYLSKEEEKEHHLRLSFDFNQKSVELFDALYGKNKLETVTSINRLVGTGIELMKCPSAYVEGKETDFIILLGAAFDFYATCDFALCAEIADSLKKIISLTELISPPSPDLRALAKKAIDTVYSLDGANEVCLDLCDRLGAM